jgi:crotonobetainyl-CoA:carnitine CoA-transferase CaiB-like acyl-CoA transferase
MELNHFFKDLKVVELASVLAGPLAGSFFAELGATVVKIENSNVGGDVTRSWKLPEEAEKTTASAYYHSANYNKKILMLDLKNNTDYHQFLNVLHDADLIISNYQKNTAEKLGIDFLMLTAKFPNLIFIQLNAFDYEDPRPGYDLVMQAETGYVSMCGDGILLAKMPVAMIDLIASHQIKEAALIALLHKLRTGAGSVIHVSLYKSALSGLINQATNYLMENHIPSPIGTRHPNIAPYGDIITTADNKKIMLVIGSDAQFAKLVKLFSVEIPDEFIKNIDRLSNRNTLTSFLNSHSILVSASDFIEYCESENIPFAIIKNMAEVFVDPMSKAMIAQNNIEESNGVYIKSIAFTN